MADVYMNSKFYFKRGKAASWKQQNIKLGPGEPGFEIDTGKLKVGNGTTAWNDLPYLVDKEEILENVSIFLGKLDELPTTADNPDGTICIVKDVPYIKVGDSWEKLAVGDVEVIKIKDDQDDALDIDGVHYTSTQEAIDAVASGTTIQLAGAPTTALSIPPGKQITIDLNGENIVNNEVNPIRVKSDGILNLQGTGSVECNKNRAPVLSNSGVLAVYDGVYLRSVDEKDNGYYVALNHGVMNIFNGTFSSPGGLSSLIENGYYNYNSGDSSTGYVEGLNDERPILQIFGGTFINNYVTIKNDDGARCVIEGGNLMGMIFNTGRELIIKGGTFTATDGYENIQNVKGNEDLNAATCYISGGTFETNGDVNISSNGLIEITGGKFNKKVPAQFIKEGYVQELIDGYYTVKKEG